MEVSDLSGTLAPHSNSTSQGYLRCVLLHYSAFAVSLSPPLSNYSFHWITFSLFFLPFYISFKSTLRTAGSSTSRFFPLSLFSTFENLYLRLNVSFVTYEIKRHRMLLSASFSRFSLILPLPPSPIFLVNSFPAENFVCGVLTFYFSTNLVTM